MEIVDGVPACRVWIGEAIKVRTKAERRKDDSGVDIVESEHGIDVVKSERVPVRASILKSFSSLLEESFTIGGAEFGD